MLLEMLAAKLHKARVTALAPDYEGSLTVDAALLKAVGMRTYEKVLVANLSNGHRFETYAIPAPAGSGTVCLNGATALLGKVGDPLIVFTFVQLTPREAARHHPRILVLNAQNRPAGPVRRG